MTDMIGVDLGGTNILAAVVADGAVVRSEKRRTPRGGPQSVADEIASMLAALDAEPGSVGVGVPGPVSGGNVHHAPNLVGWDQVVPFADLLRERVGSVPVGLVNDADAGTYAERTAGAAAGSDDVLGLWWGTGVGGGLVLDGRLRVGPGGSAAEIGHVPIDVAADAPMCGCGRRGCAEAFAGRARMEAQVRQRIEAGESSVLLEIMERKGKRRATSGVWKAALDDEDEVATDVFDDAVAALGALTAGIINTLEVDTIVLGGGMGEKLGKPLLDRLAAATEPRLMRRDVERRWVLAGLGDDAGVIGAALVGAG